MTKPVAPEVDLDDGDLDEMLFAAHAAAQSGFSHIQCDPRAIVAIITETRAHRAEQKERIGSSHNVGKPDGVRAPASSVAPAVPDTGLLRDETHRAAKLPPVGVETGNYHGPLIDGWIALQKTWDYKTPLGVRDWRVFHAGFEAARSAAAKPPVGVVTEIEEAIALLDTIQSQSIAVDSPLDAATSVLLGLRSRFTDAEYLSRAPRAKPPAGVGASEALAALGRVHRAHNAAVWSNVEAEFDTIRSALEKCR